MNPNPTSPESAPFNASDNTSLAAIRKRVEETFSDNPEGAFQEYKAGLDDILRRLEKKVKEDLRKDPRIPSDVVYNSSAFDDLVQERLKAVTAVDMEVAGIIEDMRKIRQAQAVVAADEERGRNKAAEQSNLQLEISKLQTFRDNLERLGLETTKEDARMAMLQQLLS